MTRERSAAWDELGARQYSRRDTGDKRQSTPRQPSTYRPKPQPTIDPELINPPKENDFTRWYAEECRRKGIPNILEGGR